MSSISNVSGSSSSDAAAMYREYLARIQAQTQAANTIEGTEPSKSAPSQAVATWITTATATKKPRISLRRSEGPPLPPGIRRGRLCLPTARTTSCELITGSAHGLYHRASGRHFQFPAKAADVDFDQVRFQVTALASHTFSTMNGRFLYIDGAAQIRLPARACAPW